ncbi:hypothetical protein L6R21_15895 [bacterium]|nr:hypothetical protein [bacterium]
MPSLFSPVHLAQREQMRFGIKMNAGNIAENDVICKLGRRSDEGSKAGSVAKIPILHLEPRSCKALPQSQPPRDHCAVSFSPVAPPASTFKIPDLYEGRSPCAVAVEPAETQTPASLFFATEEEFAT